MDPNQLFLDPKRPFTKPGQGFLEDHAWKYLADLQGGLTSVDLTTQVTGILPPANGGTGTNNATRTITIAGFPITLTQTALSSVTMPVSGTVISTLALQLQSATTGVVGALGTALVTLTWPHAFIDTNYVAVASVLDATAAVASLSVVHIETQSTTAIQVRVSNGSAGNLTGTVWAIGLHA